MTSLTAEDAEALYEMALRFDTERKHLSFPEYHGRLPNLVEVSQRLSGLGELLTEVSDEVLFRATAPEQTESQRQTVGVFTAAAAHVRQAIRLVSDAHYHLAVPQGTVGGPDAPDRAESATVAGERLDEARLAILTGGFLLHRAAEQQSLLSSRAARSRSALPGLPRSSGQASAARPAHSPAPASSPTSRHRR
ncbi:hypothetical protein ACLIYM_09760 [Streptomyces fenghuangensis]|uniref:hypothetical protein n=1 Tax=Streptomyces sp. ICN903 TaxID=2964654 RepID=UPI001EDC4C50|nr:hypothetical protein [Streptomyces sp. ICN903]MCG3039018.1 hypothetical protein [Streptomyces sp. ICN903]